MIKRAICLFLVSSFLLSAGGNVSAESSPYNVSNIYPLLYANGTVVDGPHPYLGENKIIYGYTNMIGMVNITDVQNPTMRSIYDDPNKGMDMNFGGPKLSRDESKIVFTSSWYWYQQANQTAIGGGLLDVLIKNTTSGNEFYDHVVLLNLTGAGIRYPAFSGDGMKIVYNSNEGGGFVVNDVWVINVNGTDRKRLTYENRGGQVQVSLRTTKK